MRWTLPINGHDPLEAVQESVQGRRHLDLCDQGARAEVPAGPEGQGSSRSEKLAVGIVFEAADIEALGVLEYVSIAIGRGNKRKNVIACRDLRTSDVYIADGFALQTLNWRYVPKDLRAG